MMEEQTEGKWSANTLRGIYLKRRRGSNRSTIQENQIKSDTSIVEDLNNLAQLGKRFGTIYAEEKT